MGSVEADAVSVPLREDESEDNTAARYIPPGDPWSEGYRLATLAQFPFLSMIIPSCLATFGFYYTGFSDCIKCISCGAMEKNWIDAADDENTEAFHNTRLSLGVRHNPECLLARRLETRNIPLYSPNIHSLIMDFYIKNQQEVQNGPQLSKALIPGSISCEGLNSDLRLEENRRQTFAKWPSYPAPYLVENLAKCGFVYLGKLDRVQCYSCSGILHNWYPDDDVENEHKKFFPHCSISTGLETENIPLQESVRDQLNEKLTLRLRQMDLIGADESYPSTETQRYLALQYPCKTPANKNMTIQQMRVDTFNYGWPHLTTIPPLRMAKAGFFFLGEGDKTKCFYCNGGLQNWEQGDDPWVEHAKWFPGCDFVFRQRGEEFMRRIFEAHPNLRRPEAYNRINTIPPGRYKVTQDPQDLTTANRTEPGQSGQATTDNTSSSSSHPLAQSGGKRCPYPASERPAKIKKSNEEAPREATEDHRASEQSCCCQPLPFGEEHKEDMRRASFARFKDCCPVVVCELARKGFYYTRVENSVKCFSCGATSRNWINREDLQAIEHHQNCAMANNVDARNIPTQLMRFDLPGSLIDQEKDTDHDRQREYPVHATPMTRLISQPKTSDRE